LTPLRPEEPGVNCAKSPQPLNMLLLAPGDSEFPAILGSAPRHPAGRSRSDHACRLRSAILQWACLVDCTNSVDVHSPNRTILISAPFVSPPATMARFEMNQIFDHTFIDIVHRFPHVIRASFSGASR
jgi:hypothetical protein